MKAVWPWWRNSRLWALISSSFFPNVHLWEEDIIWFWNNKQECNKECTSWVSVHRAMCPCMSADVVAPRVDCECMHLHMDVPIQNSCALPSALCYVLWVQEKDPDLIYYTHLPAVLTNPPFCTGCCLPAFGVWAMAWVGGKGCSQTKPLPAYSAAHPACFASFGAQTAPWVNFLKKWAQEPDLAS